MLTPIEEKRIDEDNRIVAAGGLKRKGSIRAPIDGLDGPKTFAEWSANGDFLGLQLNQPSRN